MLSKPPLFQRRGGDRLRQIPDRVAGEGLPRQPAVLRRPQQAARDQRQAPPHADRAQVRGRLRGETPLSFFYNTTPSLSGYVDPVGKRTAEHRFF